MYISMSTFERMFPPNLKRMTSAQKEMCGCEICIDFKNRFNALTAFWNKWVKVYDDAFHSLWKAGDTAQANLVQEAKRDFLEGVFLPLVEREDGEQKYQHKMKDYQEYVDSMTCGKM